MWKDNARKYCGIGKNASKELDALVEECCKEVVQIANPVFVHQRYALAHDPLSLSEVDLTLPYASLEKLFAHCDECILLAMSLGIEIDRRTTVYAHIDQAKMSVFDACASAYCEEACDQFEKNLGLHKRTMRLCPGYGDIDLVLNGKIAKILACDKHIGVYVSDNHLLMPLKSMIGLIGIGDDQQEKTCKGCFQIKSCAYRKQGTTCYAND